ncbi:GNAT family N-acetyltransferase [Streptococcus halichoeri]|uniref:GNAT family N-acetyltransferase n=1 Tax=Streptococcus halichoeri TaxID=254785 RepID=UPI001356E7D8|nr:GNAT family N-acetyltransferase [Streptococcus halichoeri]
MKLRRPKSSDQAAVMEMMAEFQAFQSPHDGGFWDLTDFDYQAWLEQNQLREAGLSLRADQVPSIQLVAFNQQGRALGFLSLRLALNAALRQKGGHIGYSVRPLERRKGYATAMLAQGVSLARQKNITRVLVTCSRTNLASRKVILANQGQLEDIQNGVERYWISKGDS